MSIIKNVTRVIICLAGSVLAGCAVSKPSGSIATYYDTRGKPTSTIAGKVSGLPLETKLNGFLDIEPEGQNNLQTPYAEIRLSKKADNGLGAAVEYNRDFSLPNGIIRLGAIYEPYLSKFDKTINIGLKFYPASTNDKGAQLGLYGRKNFNDMYVGGFLDYNFKPDKIVTDVQIGKQLKKDLYLVVEGRYNGFMRKDRFSVGAGLEYEF